MSIIDNKELDQTRKCLEALRKQLKITRQRKVKKKLKAAEELSDDEVIVGERFLREVFSKKEQSTLTT